MRTYTLHRTPGSRPSRPLPPQRPAGPLSNSQKAELSQLFRRAWTADGSPGNADEYRRIAVQAATGKAGLTACTQDDYLPAKARALEILGESGRALNLHIEHQTAPQRVAMFKLEEALVRHGKNEAYAEAIARNRFKCSLTECSAKQLWWLVFTINNRKAKPAA
jgi:hypothetical protein